MSEYASTPQMYNGRRNAFHPAPFIPAICTAWRASMCVHVGWHYGLLDACGHDSCAGRCYWPCQALLRLGVASVGVALRRPKSR